MNYLSILITSHQLFLWVLTIITYTILAKINHEFFKQSFRYKLNVVLSETDSNFISKAEKNLLISI